MLLSWVLMISVVTPGKSRNRYVLSLPNHFLLMLDWNTVVTHPRLNSAMSFSRCMLFAMLITPSVEGSADVSVRDDEKSMGVAVSPPAYWGLRIRREGELRALTLCLSGGSGGQSQCDWADQLKTSLRSSLSTLTSVQDESPLQENVSYEQLSQHRLSFESKPLEQWPNLIILETSGDCDPTAEYVKGMDHFLQSLRKKYISQNLQPPDYLLIETPRTRELMEHARKADKSQSKLDVLWNFDKSELRHQHLFDFARFYRYPLISMVDVCLPSLLRHFLCEDCQELWPYMDGSFRLSVEGKQLLVADILVPFLANLQGQPTSTDINRTSFYDDPAIVYVP